MLALQQQQQQQQQQSRSRGSSVAAQGDSATSLRTAQALLSQLGAPPTPASAATAARSALSLSVPATPANGGAGGTVQAGIYVPRDHELIGAASPVPQRVPSGTVAPRSQPQQMRATAADFAHTTAPLQYAPVPAAAPSTPSGQLSHRILEVSSLLKGFDTKFQPPTPSHDSTNGSASASNSSGRSTTPMSYQFTRRGAQPASSDASGMQSTSAGVVDSPPSGASAAGRVPIPLPAGRPNVYRAPAPVPQGSATEESTQSGPPLRPLPAAVVPGRYVRTSPPPPPAPASDSSRGEAPLSIDTSARVPPPASGVTSLSSAGSSNSSNGSAGRGGGTPLSAAAYLGSLRKPASASAALPAHIPQEMTSLGAFSPASTPGSVQIRGKFSHPHVYSAPS
jgi:hypothetical protein